MNLTPIKSLIEKVLTIGLEQYKQYLLDNIIEASKTRDSAIDADILLITPEITEREALIDKVLLSFKFRLAYKSTINIKLTNIEDPNYLFFIEEHYVKELSQKILTKIDKEYNDKNDINYKHNNNIKFDEAILFENKIIKVCMLERLFSFTSDSILLEIYIEKK